MLDVEWYTLPFNVVFDILKPGTAGLTDTEARKRLKKYGYNELRLKGLNPLIRMLLQFHNPLIYVLVVSAIVTAYFRQYIDTAVILGVVMANAIMGFILEGRAQYSIESLGKIMPHYCTVIRNGKRISLQARELVPGDVVMLGSGDRVPADLRLFYAKNLFIDESTLTGESVPVEKDVKRVMEKNVPLADSRCMAFCGTFVTRGSGKGIVVSTGEKT